MRITFILPNASLGGGTRVVAIYASELKRRGHDVVVISLPPHRPSTSQRAKELLKGRFHWIRSNQPSHLDGLDLDHRVLDSWRAVTDRDVPDGDVVIATWWETAEWAAALSPSKGKKVYFVQAHEVFPFLPLDRVKATYRLPLHKIVISRWLKSLMACEYGDSCVDLVPNSVDTAQFFAQPRGRQPAPTVGFTYSRTSLKGADVIARAIGQIRSDLGPVRAIAFGSDRVGKELPLPEGTQFFHRPPQDQLRHIYAACDVWLCGSSSEGFYLPLLEAMACRCPVVSTKVGGPVDVIQPGINGYLVEIGDWFELARKATLLLNEPETIWKSMSDAAHSTATSYTWQNATDLFENVLLRVQSA